MTKGNVFTRWMSAGVLIVALVVFPSAISVSAQNTNTGGGGTPTGPMVRDEGTDWGWLGLLGLLGLAGLLRRRDAPDRDRERRS